MKTFGKYITEKTMSAEDEVELARVKKYVSIGFSHKKMFKASAWSRAVKVMDELIEMGYVIPFDFGRGKGKYDTPKSADKYSIEEIGQIAYDAGIRVKPMRGE